MDLLKCRIKFHFSQNTLPQLRCIKKITCAPSPMLLINNIVWGVFVYKFFIIVKGHPSEFQLDSPLLYSTYHCDNFNTVINIIMLIYKG